MATSKPPARPTFTRFAERVLRLRFTLGQRVVAKVCFDGIEPGALLGAEREVARLLFGEVDVVPPLARRILVLILGRESGKTLLSAAFAVYVMVTAALIGRELDLPTFVAIAPGKRTAGLLVGMARKLVGDSPELAPLVEQETAEGFVLKRPDGRRVQLSVFAASRGGVAVRGLPILGFVMDESWFFLSEDGAVVNDRDNFRALIARLMKEGLGVFITTPWPVSTLTGELFEQNFGAPAKALACRGPTLVMRDNDPEIADRVAAERELDPENTARERDADTSGVDGAGSFFDPTAIAAAVDAGLVLPAPLPRRAAIGFAGDVALVRDSTTGCVVARAGEVYTVLALEEWRPKPKDPLKPSVVAEGLIDLADRYDAETFMADGHYSESLREFLTPAGVRFVLAPPNQDGKLETYLHAKKLIHEGRVRLPNHPRLLQQLRSVVARKVDGGGTKITSPRRVGGGHGDLVSALVLALWRASRARAGADGAARADAALPPIMSGASTCGAESWIGSSDAGTGGNWTPYLLDSVRRGERP